MSPQRSNRRQLIEGTLRCLERLPAGRITTRAIAEESGANVASIAYHFGSKDDLVTEAVVEGLDRWLEEIANALGEVDARSPRERLQAAMAVIETTRQALVARLEIALARQVQARLFPQTAPQLKTLD